LVPGQNLIVSRKFRVGLTGNRTQGREVERVGDGRSCRFGALAVRHCRERGPHGCTKENRFGGWNRLWTEKHLQHFRWTGSFQGAAVLNIHRKRGRARAFPPALGASRPSAGPRPPPWDAILKVWRKCVGVNITIYAPPKKRLQSQRTLGEGGRLSRNGTRLFVFTPR